LYSNCKIIGLLLSEHPKIKDANKVKRMILYFIIVFL